MIPKSMLVNIARENGLYVDALKNCDNIADLEFPDEPLKFLPNSILAVVRKFVDSFWFGFESEELYDLISGSEVYSFDVNYRLPKDDKHKACFKGEAKTHVFMVDDNTVDLALKLSLKHKADVDFPMIGVLNFANQKHRGGGYLHGAMAQEEELCRCTTLYTALKHKLANDYYNEKRNKEKYQVLYSPNVIIFRNSQYQILNEFFPISVITAAAPNKNLNPELFSNDEAMKKVLYYRIRNIILTAIDNGVEYLVLGAFGCGAFHNDPKLVATCFYEVLFGKEQLHKHFKEIYFAIPKISSASLKNYQAFEKVLGKVSSTVSLDFIEDLTDFIPMAEPVTKKISYPVPMISSDMLYEDPLNKVIAGVFADGRPYLAIFGHDPENIHDVNVDYVFSTKEIPEYTQYDKDSYIATSGNDGPIRELDAAQSSFIAYSHSMKLDDIETTKEIFKDENHYDWYLKNLGEYLIRQQAVKFNTDVLNLGLNTFDDNLGNPMVVAHITLQNDDLGLTAEVPIIESEYLLYLDKLGVVDLFDDFDDYDDDEDDDEDSMFEIIK